MIELAVVGHVDKKAAIRRRISHNQSDYESEDENRKKLNIYNGFIDEDDNNNNNGDKCHQKKNCAKLKNKSNNNQ